jgi:hypothetical protein
VPIKEVLSKARDRMACVHCKCLGPEITSRKVESCIPDVIHHERYSVIRCTTITPMIVPPRYTVVIMIVEWLRHEVFWRRTKAY